MVLMAQVLSPVSAVVNLEAKLCMVLLSPRQPRRSNEVLSPARAVVLIAPPPLNGPCLTGLNTWMVILTVVHLDRQPNQPPCIAALHGTNLTKWTTALTGLNTSMVHLRVVHLTVVHLDS